MSALKVQIIKGVNRYSDNLVAKKHKNANRRREVNFNVGDSPDRSSSRAKSFAIYKPEKISTPKGLAEITPVENPEDHESKPRDTKSAMIARFKALKELKRKGIDKPIIEEDTDKLYLGDVKGEERNGNLYLDDAKTEESTDKLYLDDANSKGKNDKLYLDDARSKRKKDKLYLDDSKSKGKTDKLYLDNVKNEERTDEMDQSENWAVARFSSRKSSGKEVAIPEITKDPKVEEEPEDWINQRPALANTKFEDDTANFDEDASDRSGGHYTVANYTFTTNRDPLPEVEEQEKKIENKFNRFKEKIREKYENSDFKEANDRNMETIKTQIKALMDLMTKKKEPEKEKSNVDYCKGGEDLKEPITQVFQPFKSPKSPKMSKFWKKKDKGLEIAIYNDEGHESDSEKKKRCCF